MMRAVSSMPINHALLVEVAGTCEQIDAAPIELSFLEMRERFPWTLLFNEVVFNSERSPLICRFEQPLINKPIERSWTMQLKEKLIMDNWGIGLDPFR
ncbi:hypothetical protein Tco_1554816 [Tanacetum coccineum]